jgi:steroid delta-isomerase-like uncharacterized protein
LQNRASTTQKGEQLMSVKENKAIARRWIEEAWNQGKMEVLDEIIGPDCPWGKGRGPDPFKSWYSEQYTLCPDLHMTIEEIVAEDDKVVVYIEFQGTVTGEMEGWPKPTGKHVTVRAVQFMRFRDGKIVELRHLQNVLDSFQQVGILPPTEEIVQQAIAKQE